MSKLMKEPSLPSGSLEKNIREVTKTILAPQLQELQGQMLQVNTQLQAIQGQVSGLKPELYEMIKALVVSLQAQPVDTGKLFSFKRICPSQC